MFGWVEQRFFLCVLGHKSAESWSIFCDWCFFFFLVCNSLPSKDLKLRFYSEVWKVEHWCFICYIVGFGNLVKICLKKQHFSFLKGATFFKEYAFVGKVGLRIWKFCQTLSAIDFFGVWWTEWLNKTRHIVFCPLI